jgi:hypothetical protein
MNIQVEEKNGVYSVFINGKKVVEASQVHITTLDELHKELRELRPLKALASTLAGAAGHLSTLPTKEAEKYLTGLGEGIKGVKVPHPLDTGGIIPPIVPPLGAEYRNGYERGVVIQGASEYISAQIESA